MQRLNLLTSHALAHPHRPCLGWLWGDLALEKPSSMAQAMPGDIGGCRAGDALWLTKTLLFVEDSHHYCPPS